MKDAIELLQLLGMPVTWAILLVGATWMSRKITQYENRLNNLEHSNMDLLFKFDAVVHDGVIKRLNYHETELEVLKALCEQRHGAHHTKPAAEKA